MIILNKNRSKKWNNPKGKKVIIKYKPKSVMGDYIAVHGLMPKNELPKRLRNKIPKNEIWIRRKHRETLKRLKKHENIEYSLMQNDIPYKKAHQIASRYG